MITYPFICNMLCCISKWKSIPTIFRDFKSVTCSKFINVFIKDAKSFSGDPCGKEAEHRFRVFMQFALCLKIQSGMVPKDAYGEFVTALSTDKLMQEARTLYKEQLARRRPNGVPVLQ